MFFSQFYFLLSATDIYFDINPLVWRFLYYDDRVNLGRIPTGIGFSIEYCVNRDGCVCVCETV